MGVRSRQGPLIARATSGPRRPHYEGLASIGNDFLAFFAQAGPVTGQSDVYSVRAHP
jgi:hypothetical protein